MNRHYSAVAERAAQRCEYCHAQEAVFNFAFEVEHIVPQSRGGSSDESNLALACRSCNLFKSDAVAGGGEQKPLFNPRTQQWEEHFSVVSETAEITGLTETGRATVAQLQMNRPRQVSAHKRWMQLGIFP